MIEKFTVSRDDSIYEAWPDVALTRSTRLVCAFTECTHHLDRTYSRIMVADSVDRGRTWSAKRPVTEATRGSTNWNGPRIVRLNDGRLVVIVEKSLRQRQAARPYPPGVQRRRRSHVG